MVTDIKVLEENEIVEASVTTKARERFKKIQKKEYQNMKKATMSILAKLPIF